LNSPGTVLHTPTLDCRQIDASEEKVIAEAARLDREVWGELGQVASHFECRARNGVLIGAWHWSGLIGTISCLRADWAPVHDLGESHAPRYSTWDGMTSGGTFDAAGNDGDALFCVAVTTMDSGPRPSPEIPDERNPALDLARVLDEHGDALDDNLADRTSSLALACAETYIPGDYVMRFHMKPKGGGVLGGAEIVAVLPNGRPADLDSMGYNVILAYPEIGPDYVFPSELDIDISAGEALVLAAASFAIAEGIRIVAPYSRPSGFRCALIRRLVDIGTGNASKNDPLTTAIIGWNDFQNNP